MRKQVTKFTINTNAYMCGIYSVQSTGSENGVKNEQKIKKPPSALVCAKVARQ